MKRLALFLILATATSDALAQSNLQWIRSADDAVKRAQAQKKPILVYVRLPDDQRPETDDADSDIQRNFRDPRVQKRAQMFIPLLLTQSRQNREYITQFGLSATATMEMAFVAPDGKPLAPTLATAGARQAESLMQRLGVALTAWGKMIYDTELKPTITDEKAEAAAIQRAVKLTGELRVKTADADLLTLLERENLPAAARSATLDALAALSSKAAITRLVELGRKDDAAAIKALEKATPAGAELMLDELKDKDGNFYYFVYSAITRICGIKDAKQRGYFENSKPDFYEKELERVRGIVRQQAKVWRNENE
jgi:hypothetical protein